MTEQNQELIFSLEDLENGVKQPDKPKRKFSEVSPIFYAAGLRRIHYKLDGSWCSGKVFENVLHGLPIEGSYNGEQDRLVTSVHPIDPTRPNLFKWVSDLPTLDRRFFPKSIRICDLRFLGLNRKGEELIIKEQDLKHIPSSVPVSRLMQVATGSQDYTTFEWVDVKKKKGDE